jgi:hypothetical protein
MLLIESSNSASSTHNSLEDLKRVVNTRGIEISVTKLKRLSESRCFDEETTRKLEGMLSR